MKDITKNILHFLKHNFAKDIKQVVDAPQFSTKSTQMLKQLHKTLVLSEKTWDLGKIDIVESNTELMSGSQCTKGGSYDNLPHEIKDIINRSKVIQKKYEFNYGGRKINITFVFPISEHHSRINSEISKFCRDALRKMFMWLFIADKYAEKRCSNTMNIHFYATDHLKKVANTKDQPLDQIHINTAFTTSCSNSTELYIFRLEEWFKVFIHETFHNMGLDFSHVDNTISDQRMRKIFPVSADVRLYETYCEMWAEIMNTMFVSYFSTTAQFKTDPAFIIKKMEGFLQFEAMFSAFQCAKVLDHNGMTYTELIEIYTNPQKSPNSALKYKEKTNALSYYVIKSVLMVNMNMFVEWCALNNHKSLDFTETSKTIGSYCNMIEQIYRSPKYLAYSFIMEKWFQNKHIRKNTMEGQTLRMTVYEI